MNPIPTLIADDSGMIVKIIKKALLANVNPDFEFHEDYIFTASDGMEAFETMALHPSIRLIISDVNMPHLNGDEFIEILQDTKKISNLDVIFVTATSTKMLFKPSIKENTLGTIFKPFNIETFNTKMAQLYKDKEQRVEDLKKLAMVHLSQRMQIKKICVAYLEHQEIDFDANILNHQIGEHFHNDHIKESEYAEIVHSSLSLYMLETGTSHVIDSKRIRCIIKSMDETVVFKENRYELIKGFKEMLNAAKEQDDLKDMELVEALTDSMTERISLAYAGVKKYPLQNPKRFATQFNYIIKELGKLDCEFLDVKLQKLIIDLKETTRFTKWMNNFISQDQISHVSPNIKKTPYVYNQVIAKYKDVYKRNNIIRHHIAGEIDFHIWRRAKDSKEILSYLKKKMAKKMPNSLEFLLHRERITPADYRREYQNDKKKVVVISHDMKKLEIFKSIEDRPFDNWQFFAFAKQSLFKSWLNANEADIIVVDYAFHDNIIKNGLQVTRILSKTNPSIAAIIKKHKLFMIVNPEDVIELNKSKTASNFVLMDTKLSISSISKTLLYG